MGERLFVTWTMDCETIQVESPVTGGPADWGLAERAIRGYVETLAARGQRVTLFLIPRLAEAQAAVVRDMAEQGAELGVHLHPQTTDLGYAEHLGQLPAGTQRELIRSARDRVADAVGAVPRAFRPGCISASDATYSILSEEGFTHGSVSLPGRHRPDLGADWAGADPFAHFASANNRLAAGDLPFLELPIAADPDDFAGPPQGLGDARHIRLERDGICDWGPTLIAAHLRRQIADGVPLKTLVLMTHNTREYGSLYEPARQGLEAVLAAIDRIAPDLGLDPQPATLSEIRAAAT